MQRQRRASVGRDAARKRATDRSVRSDDPIGLRAANSGSGRGWRAPAYGGALVSSRVHREGTPKTPHGQDRLGHAHPGDYLPRAARATWGFPPASAPSRCQARLELAQRSHCRRLLFAQPGQPRARPALPGAAAVRPDLLRAALPRRPARAGLQARPASPAARATRWRPPRGVRPAPAESSNRRIVCAGAACAARAVSCSAARAFCSLARSASGWLAATRSRSTSASRRLVSVSRCTSAA